MYQVAYGLHSLSAVVFIILLFLPLAIKGIDSKTGEEKVRRLKLWRRLVNLGNLFLVLSLVTGLVMGPNYASLWFWLVLAVFVAIGAFLGMAGKRMRLVAEAVNQGHSSQEDEQKLQRFALLLTVSIVLMLILMLLPW